MSKSAITPFLALIICALLVTQHEAHAQRYNNNYYYQQQQQRQQQMMQQQRQQQMQRQRQEQMRRQQEMQRQQQLRQQQQMRARQQQMQRQMQQRQQQAVRQRQQMAQKQQQMQQQRQVKQRNQQKIQGQKLQRSKQQQRVLKQQKQVKLRRERLNRLKKNRLSIDKIQKVRRNEQQALTLAALGNNYKSKLRSSISLNKPNLQKLSISQLRKQRVNLQNRQKTTIALAQQRKSIQTKLRKINETQKKYLSNKQKEKSKSQKQTNMLAKAKKVFPSCNGKSCSTDSCSFHGDTMVLTMDGFEPIRSIESGIDYVWSKDEFTGETDWKPVINHYSNTYHETVTITVNDPKSGQNQEIVSNLIHPFFVTSTSDESSLQVSAVEISQGTTRRTEQWKEAQYLDVGDFLYTNNNSAAEVIGKEIENITFEAFNLTVDDYHTYFISSSLSANNESAAFWVHNDCDKTLFGANGVKIHGSKELWTSKNKTGRYKGRIDLENPAPGRRPGQIHYQGRDNKPHIYDPKTKSFPTAPGYVNRLVKKDKRMKAAIDKGMNKYLGEY